MIRDGTSAPTEKSLLHLSPRWNMITQGSLLHNMGPVLHAGCSCAVVQRAVFPRACEDTKKKDRKEKVTEELACSLFFMGK